MSNDNLTQTADNDTARKALTHSIKYLTEKGEAVGAKLLLSRLAELETPVRIVHCGDRIAVTSPFIANRKKFMALVMELKKIESRDWDADAKVTYFAKKDEEAVMKVLNSFYQGNTFEVVEDEPEEKAS